MMPLGAYIEGQPRISLVPLDLGQGGRCLRLHRRKGKAEEQISSWRMVVLCAETSTKLRLCAQATYQGMQFGRSSVILNEAGGEVKDLEFHSGFLEQILRCRSE